MVIQELADSADPRLRDYVALRDVSLRKSLEAEEGLFIAEGEKIIRRAAEAGYRPRSFLLAERWLQGLQDVIDRFEAPVYVVTEEFAEAVTGFHVHRGALASFQRQNSLNQVELSTSNRILVLEDIVDHTNVGAIIRCGAGLGWNAVLLAPRCADPLYRRAIKTSMGTVFSLPWARMNDWASGLDGLKKQGFTIVAMALTNDSVSLEEYAEAPDGRIALLLGTEGDGLSSHWLAQADVVVRIPMQHGVDSLNVAAAAAIACYELRQKTD